MKCPEPSHHDTVARQFERIHALEARVKLEETRADMEMDRAKELEARAEAAESIAKTRADDIEYLKARLAEAEEVIYQNPIAAYQYEYRVKARRAQGAKP